jgi:hypothetical protein
MVAGAADAPHAGSSSPWKGRFMRRPLIALAVLLLPLFGAEVARADGMAGRCEGRVIEQPFAAFDDPADYFLAPDGDFSSGAAGWDLGDAEVVGDNEPWNVTGGDVVAALHLAPGASAASPTICVAADDPTMRFFARGSGGDLQVDVLYTDELGEPQSLTIGTLSGDGAWEPTPALPITANTYEMAVGFRFTALGDGDWTIDDVYVDPYRKGRPTL